MKVRKALSLVLLLVLALTLIPSAQASPMHQDNCSNFTIPPGGVWTASWFDTGIEVYPGQTITFTASGTVRPSQAYDIFTGPDGTTAIQYWMDDYSFRSDWPSEAVIARIDGGELIYIGSGQVLTISKGGTLELGVNDTDPGNNSGSFQVEICWQERTADSDGDGVPDDEDKCPDTPLGTEVDEYGCPVEVLDSDGDGIPDDKDMCPDTPLGTEVDEYGCPVEVLDSDGDGVPNDEDKCADTPRGTEVDEDGCPVEVLDSDGDGVPNDKDWCPDTPRGTEVDEDGCPVEVLDSDGDGVPDVEDRCDDTPRGTEVDEYGCPVEVWASVCASAKIRIAGGSEFKRAKFTIGGTEPQEVRITQPAKNFAIVKEYGGLVYQVIDGKSWGSLTLEPGTYILSCNGGGAMGLMSATVCIEYPVVEGAPSGPGEQEVPEAKYPPKLPDPPGKETKPSLPLGRIVKIVVRSADRDDDIKEDHLYMVIGQKKRFKAWGEDANRNKRGVTVDEWKVRDEDENSGSIDKDGLFKAGPKEGWVKIRATAEGITGVFRIKVDPVAPITFIGCLKLYDEHKKPVHSGGAKVNLSASIYKTCDDMNQVPAMRFFGFDTHTDAKGRFKFVVPAWLDHSSSVCWLCYILYDLPTAPPGYVWRSVTLPNSRGYSNQANYLDAIKPGRSITIAPDGLECFELWLGKMPTSVLIDGKVTHHGKPVEKAEVRLLYNGKRVKDTRSDKHGEFKLYVDSLPKGRYRLTAQYKPKDPPKDAPWDPNNVITVHGWLYIRKDRLVELPLKTERKTIDIEMISFAEKIGYTGP